jgi:cell division protein FtsQ
MRYVRFRADRGTTRVLGDPRESGLRDRHRIDEFSADRDDRAVRASGMAGMAGATGESWRQSGRGSRDVSGMTVREHRERQRLARRRARGIPVRAVVLFAAVILLIAAAAVVYWSPLLAVRETRVEGLQRLSSERVTTLAAVPADATLLRLDIEGIQDRLAADPWVISASVSRSFPSTLVLTVAERQVGAVVEIPSSQNGVPDQRWLVSKDGVWLGLLSAVEAGEASGNGEGTDGSGGEGSDGGGSDSSGGEGASDSGGEAGDGSLEGQASGGQDAGPDTEQGTEPRADPNVFGGVSVSADEIEQLLPIRNVSQTLDPQVGGHITDEGIINALAIVNGFSPEMLALVRSISAPDRIKTMISLTNNVEVAFGVAEDIEDKEQVIRGMLTAYEGRLTYINVRVANRATIRATE